MTSAGDASILLTFNPVVDDQARLVRHRGGRAAARQPSSICATNRALLVEDQRSVEIPLKAVVTGDLHR